MKVDVGGQMIALSTSAMIGKGGEAEVYDIGGGRVAKIFKDAGHPDFTGMGQAAKLAEQRIAEHQRKLLAFPGGLPERAVVPIEIVRNNGGKIIGYAMEHIGGARHLHRLSEPRVRRATAVSELISVLLDLHSSVVALHSKGVVIGDFNDLNVLVKGRHAYLIDTDSYQFGAFVCRLFTERFVDPLECEPKGMSPVLLGGHSARTDWYAFSVMVMRTLLCVGPYGGVFKPSKKSHRVSHGRRPLERITVFNPSVIYPKPAIHYGHLPDPLLDYLSSVFVDDHRSPFPRTLLSDLVWTTCRGCGAEHGRQTCPGCKARPARRRGRSAVSCTDVFKTAGFVIDARVVAGQLEWRSWQGGAVFDQAGRELGRSTAGRASDESLYRQSATHRFWFAGSRLLRNGQFGDEVVGTVVSTGARMWVGDHFGAGFYPVGALLVGFVFEGSRLGINDQVRLPRLRGQLIDATVVVGDRLAWFILTEQLGGRPQVHVTVVNRRGEVHSSMTQPLVEGHWLASASGGFAVGSSLFVPTDEGIVRIDDGDSAPRLGRRFEETEPHVDAACRLVPASGGIYVLRNSGIVRLALTGGN